MKSDISKYYHLCKQKVIKISQVKIDLVSVIKMILAEHEMHCLQKMPATSTVEDHITPNLDIGKFGLS